jgi:nucleoside-diphosphate-sugar epimerase
MDLGIKGKKIFLTGASGFIGARLAECFTSALGVEVHAFIRRIGTVGTARLARLPGLKMFHGDIRDVESIKKAAEGCSYFIHCATDTSGSRRQQREVTVGGTRNMLEAAVQLKAERMLYFSSAAVHGPARSSGVIREEDPLNGSSSYAQMKILAESLICQYHNSHRLPVVILRPTSVWGPFSPNWTIAAVELIRKKVAFLPLEGSGAANAVYIDNLVDAVCLALTKTESIGQVFLINDDEPKTWGELYGGYARFLGFPVPFIPDSPRARDLLWVSLYNAGRILQESIAGKTENCICTLRQVYEHVPVAKGLVSMLPEPVKQRLRMYAADRETSLGISGPPKGPQAGFLRYSSTSRHIQELYGSKSRYSNEKVKRVLGWTPRVSFQEALDRTFQWLQYAGYKD